MQRLTRKALAPVLAVVALLLLAPGTALAAHPCKPVRLNEGTRAKVATLDTSCRFGREVARTYFRRILDGDRFDGKTRDGLIFYSVIGFRCFPGLAGTQMWCGRHDHWVMGSIRPGDHPSTWGPYRRVSSSV